MKAGRASRTAEAAAALRANHYINADNPIFSDPYALQLTGKEWRELLSQSLIVKAMNSALLGRTLGLLTAQVVARSRYAEDGLINALAQGTRQYVLVGAGLDSFVLREAARYPELKIYEVDHPDTQALKQQQLQKHGAIPHNVEFVSIDFEKEKLSDALARSSYQPSETCFFSWLGTTHYLSPETTLATLSNIASISAPGSELIMDYSVDFRALQGIERIGSFAVSQFTRLLKEPLIGAFKPQSLHTAVNKMGFSVIEDLSGRAITERYFQQRADRMQHTAATHLIHLSRT